MSHAAGFFALAGAFMLAGHFGLGRARWTHRSPRLAIAFWQALAGAVVVSLLLGSICLALPGFSPVGTAGEILHACFVELRRQYSTPAGAAVSAVGFGLFFLVMWRVARALARHHREATLARRQHRQALALVESPLGQDVVVLDHGSAAVYCIPDGRRSRRGKIVVTRGAADHLTARQLELVLRHERVHLAARHDRLVQRSLALAEALPLLPFFGVAHQEIADLAEMHADDGIETEDGPELASALLQLAVMTPSRVPSGALAATGGATLARARRLVQPQPPLRRMTTGLIVAAIVGTGAAPALLTAYSGGESGFTHACCSRPALFS